MNPQLSELSQIDGGAIGLRLAMLVVVFVGVAGEYMFRREPADHETRILQTTCNVAGVTSEYKVSLQLLRTQASQFPIVVGPVLRSAVERDKEIVLVLGVTRDLVGRRYDNRIELPISHLDLGRKLDQIILVCREHRLAEAHFHWSDGGKRVLHVELPLG